LTCHHQSNSQAVHPYFKDCATADTNFGDMQLQEQEQLLLFTVEMRLPMDEDTLAPYQPVSQ